MNKNSVKEKYQGKYFSILGDSVSTFEGYNPIGYAVYYMHEKLAANGLYSAADTWWQMVINHFGGRLLVNGSWSGGTVVKLPRKDDLFPSGCSERRIEELSIEETEPDVIMVYLGTNDWGRGTYHEREHKLESFGNAYRDMIEKIKRRYEKAEIWCFTLNESYISRYPSVKFEYVVGDEHIEKYNETIKNICEEMGCRYVDIYSHHVPYDTKDGAHPNYEGMKTLAALCIEEIEGKQIE